MAGRLLMIHQRVVVHQLLSAEQVKAVQMALRMFLFQPDAQLVPHEVGAGKGEREIIIQALATLPHRDMLYETKGLPGCLDDRMIHSRIGLYYDLHQAVDEDL